MKVRFTIISLCFLTIMTIAMSHSGGRATQFSEGNTGAPGDDNKTCATCHSGGSFGTDIAITLQDAEGNDVTDYVGGATYTVTATINTTTAPGGYGLQMVGLINSSENNAGEMASASSNAQLAVVNGRTYLEQAGLSAINTFEAEWTAPTEGSGAVTFYATGHAANGNGQSSGDEAQSVSMEFGENIIESTVDFENDLFTISPNPVADFTTISLDRIVNGTLNVYSGNGQVIFTSDINSNEVVVNLTNYPQGTYLVSIANKENIVVSTKQLIKL